MTEPPRPPGAGDADRYPPEPTMPLAPSGSPSTPAEPTAPLAEPSGYPPPGGSNPPGGWSPSSDEPTWSTPSYEPPTQQYEPPAYPGPGDQPAGYPPSVDHPTSGGHFAATGYPPPGDQGGYPPQGDYPPHTPPGSYPPPGGTDAFPPPGNAGEYAPPGGTGGYPPSGGNAPGPVGGDDRMWAVLAHVGGPIGIVVGATLFGWVGPLIVLLVRGKESPAVRAHAVAALNFQITWTVAILVGWLLTVITCGVLFFVPTLMSIVPIVFGIVATLKANQDLLYQYPMSRQFVR